MSMLLSAALVGLTSPKGPMGPKDSGARNVEILVHQSDPTPWQAAAACAGLSPSVVFSRRGKEAAPALRACAVCPVSRECEAAVAPAESWFDGVCAGRLWRNGRPVKPRRRRGAPAASAATAPTALEAALDAAAATLAPAALAPARALAGSAAGGTRG
ncbi:WhiB family transcriptional regulator [Streptomyces sp. NPDC014779]|uniref:WhiB family transcriptional regulator n=1 Tax=unclassified Streptomyces TaxID=2593676 RepID=UPI0037006056